MHIVLCGLQSPINIGMILRSAEAYANTVTIVDTFKVLENRTSVETLSDFASGAFQRTPPRVMPDYSEIRSEGGRLVLATATGRAVPMTRFIWRSDDILLIGNEYSGVPPLLAESAEVSVRIEMPQVFAPKPPSISPIDPSRVSQIENASESALNVAVAASALIIDAHAKEQMAISGD